MSVRTVENFMTKSVVTLTQTAIISQVIKTMTEKTISCVVITDEANKPAGIITERDMIKKVLYNRLNPDQKQVSEIMSSPVITIPKDTDIFDAMMTMQKNKFRRVVVTDEQGILIGVVTQTDLFKAIVSIGI